MGTAPLTDRVIKDIVITICDRKAMVPVRSHVRPVVHLSHRGLSFALSAARPPRLAHAAPVLPHLSQDRGSARHVAKPLPDS